MPTSSNLPLQNEDTLNLKLVEVSVIDGEKSIADATTHLLLEGASIPEDLQTIPETELEVLYQEVASFATNAKKCVTALRIFYGAQSVDGQIVMQLFYQPLFLAYSHYEANTHNYMYDISESGELYSYEADSFQTTTAQVLEDAQQLFKDSLTLKHRLEDQTFEPFVEGIDIESVVIPFQSIFTLLHDNGNTELTIKSSIDLILHDELYPVKQSLLLFSEVKNPQGALAGKFANRGRILPPNTNFGFDLE